MFAFSEGLYGTSAVSANSYVPFRLQVPTTLPLWRADSRWSSQLSLNSVFDWFPRPVRCPPLWASPRGLWSCFLCPSPREAARTRWERASGPEPPGSATWKPSPRSKTRVPLKTCSVISTTITLVYDGAFKLNSTVLHSAYFLSYKYHIFHFHQLLIFNHLCLFFIYILHHHKLF